MTHLTHPSFARRRWSMTALAAVAVVHAASACVPKTQDTPSDDAGPQEADVDPADVVGAFVVQLVGPTADRAGYTSILGRFATGPTPQSVAFDETLRVGACALSRPRIPFCDGGCGAGVCVADDTCAEYPRALDLGPVHVEGLATDAGGSALELLPIAGNYQAPATPALVYPAVVPGAPVSLVLDGTQAGLGASTVGVAPFTGTAPSLTLARSAPFAVAWDADSAGAVALKLDISHHGGTRGVVRCAPAVDTGGLTIDTAVVDALLDLGVSGFPTVVLERAARGTSAEGAVTLDVTTTVEIPLNVPGVVSCTSNADCAADQTCADDLVCR